MKTSRAIDVFRNEFLDRQGIQFNCAGLAPLSRRAFEAANAVMTLLQTQAGRTDAELISVLVETRKELALFLDAAESHVGFTPNTATALSIAALGFSLKPKDQVVTIDQEYSSSFYPWKVACDRSGAELRVVSFGRKPILGSDATQVLLQSITNRTRVVAVSWVQFLDGLTLDLRLLSQQCQKVGAYLVVDGIQGLGQLPFSMRDTPVDFIAGAAHKWMCGLLGQGFFAVSDRLMSELTPIVVGGGTFGRFGTTADPSAAWVSGARRFEPGGFNFSSLAALRSAMQLIQETGIETIESEIRARTSELRPRLMALESQGLVMKTHPQERGGITSFQLPVEWEARFLTRARESEIACSKRGDYIRTAIHAFSTEAEVARFLQVLESSYEK